RSKSTGRALERRSGSQGRDGALCCVGGATCQDMHVGKRVQSIDGEEQTSQFNGRFGGLEIREPHAIPRLIDSMDLRVKEAGRYAGANLRINHRAVRKGAGNMEP